MARSVWLERVRDGVREVVRVVPEADFRPSQIGVGERVMAFVKGGKVPTVVREGLACGEYVEATPGVYRRQDVVLPGGAARARMVGVRHAPGSMVHREESGSGWTWCGTSLKSTSSRVMLSWVAAENLCVTCWSEGSER